MSPHYQKFGLPIVTDHVQNYAGPLLGIFSAMRWFLESEQHRDIKYLACFAADVPEFPGHVVPSIGASDADAIFYCHLYMSPGADSAPIFTLEPELGRYR